MLRRKDFIHRNIKYSFNWNYKYHTNKLNQINSNREDYKKLEAYFKRIINENYVPNHLFNRRSSPRVSQFKIRGIKKAFLLNFGKKLIREGKIKVFDSNTKLPKYVQSVYNSFKENKINRNPGHDPVLKNILIKDNNSIAIEIPIWKINKENLITGHIDLMQIQDNTIKVIDYKPEGNFLASIPQVATYGLLVKNLFNITNLQCVTFNKNEVWEYNPLILLTDIKEYLTSKKIERPWEEFISED